MNRKRVPADGTGLRQKALSLDEDFSKGPPGRSEVKQETKSEEKVGTGKYKVTEEAVSANEKLPPHFRPR